jgi:hypothetical protein
MTLRAPASPVAAASARPFLPVGTTTLSGDPVLFDWPLAIPNCQATAALLVPSAVRPALRVARPAAQKTVSAAGRRLLNAILTRFRGLRGGGVFCRRGFNSNKIIRAFAACSENHSGSRPA